MKKKINARHSTLNTKKDLPDPKISKHFSELGKASWEARKQKILDLKDKSVS